MQLQAVNILAVLDSMDVEFFAGIVYPVGNGVITQTKSVTFFGGKVLTTLQSWILCQHRQPYVDLCENLPFKSIKVFSGRGHNENSIHCVTLYNLQEEWLKTLRLSVVSGQECLPSIPRKEVFLQGTFLRKIRI